MDARLSEIRKRVEAATPGKWVVDREQHLTATIFCVLTEARKYITGAWFYHGRQGPDECQDANFIAHSREDVPFLLAEIEKRDEALKEAAAILSRFKAGFKYETTDEFGDPLMCNIISSETVEAGRVFTRIAEIMGGKGEV